MLPTFKLAIFALLTCSVHSLMEWGSWRQPLAYDNNLRRRTLLAHSDYVVAQDLNNAIGQQIDTIRPVNRAKMWPPWPFHMIFSKRSQEEEEEITAANTYPSAAALFVAFCRQRVLVFIRQCQEIGSQVSRQQWTKL